MSKITKSKLYELLSARNSNNPYSKLADIPKPDSFKDIKKATQRIQEAILNKETITVVGDYDVDGVVSTSIIVDFFRTINYEVNYLIPNRFKHGYGLSPKIVDLIDEGLVITVDNGITAVDAAASLKNEGIDLIITDHHTVGDEIPDALAIVNPKQEDCQFPFKEICGAQVAWYLCAAIKAQMNLDVNMTSFLDLLCIAIIADIMPMTSLNFTMVKYGLSKIKTSQRPALIELNEIMRKEKFISDDIGFFIAPKINSAGRMEDASIALNFLLSQDKYAAQDGLYALNDLNDYRKTQQEQMSQKAMAEVDDHDKAIVVWGEDWHEGVIGIVASKLSNHYKKPAFIFSINDGIAKGSARANGDINLHTIIAQTQDLLLGFGGHKNAAGLSLKKENLIEFKNRINEIVTLSDKPLHITPKTIGELNVSSVDMEFISIIDEFEPYGLNNIKPIFQISDAIILKEELIGKDKNHLKLVLKADNIIFEAIRFHFNTKLNLDKINLIVTVSKNEFRGVCKPQFLVQDVLY